MDSMTLFEELQAMARAGLHYATNPYDRQRYERLLELATTFYGETLALPADEVRARFAHEFGQLTPKIGAQAALFDDQGRILLMQRADDQTWCLPCGWVEPNEEPARCAVREAWEETGLEVEVVELVGVFMRPANVGAGPHSMVGVNYLCRVTGGTLHGSHEGEQVRYWSLDEVPVWHPQHETYARSAHAAWQRRRGG